MDVFLLAPFTGERPQPAATTYLGPDDDWTDAPELGMLAKVFTQDSFNMPMVQKGLETTRQAGRDAGQLPGVEGALVARPARPMGREG